MLHTPAPASRRRQAHKQHAGGSNEGRGGGAHQGLPPHQQAAAALGAARVSRGGPGGARSSAGRRAGARGGLGAALPPLRGAHREQRAVLPHGRPGEGRRPGRRRAPAHARRRRRLAAWGARGALRLLIAAPPTRRCKARWCAWTSAARTWTLAARARPSAPPPSWRWPTSPRWVLGGTGVLRGLLLLLLGGLSCYVVLERRRGSGGSKTAPAAAAAALAAA